MVTCTVTSVIKHLITLLMVVLSALASSAEGLTILSTSGLVNNGFYDAYFRVACDSSGVSISTATPLCSGFGQGWAPAAVNGATANSVIASATSTANILIAGSDAATEGTWVWQAGRMKGQVFYTAGACVSGYYCNWEAGQPDNFMGAQNEAVVWESTSSPSRRWDDSGASCFACERSPCNINLDCVAANTLSFDTSRYFEVGSSCGCVCKPGFGGDRCQLVVTTTTAAPTTTPTTTPNPTTTSTTTPNPTTTPTTTPNPTTTPTTTPNPTTTPTTTTPTTTPNPTTTPTTTPNPTTTPTTTPNPTTTPTTTPNPTTTPTTTHNPTTTPTTTPNPTTTPTTTPNPTTTPTTTPNPTTPTTTPNPMTTTAESSALSTTTADPTATVPPPMTTSSLGCTVTAFSSLLIDASGTSADGGLVQFSLPAHHWDGAAIPLRPLWARPDGDTAGDARLANAFLVVADDVRCILASTTVRCTVPALPLPTDLTTTAASTTASFTAAVTVPPAIETTGCNASVLALHLTVFAAGAESSTLVAAAVAIVVGVATGLSVGFALLVEPWALEPLVLIGVLDGPCAPVAARSAARFAVYILNPFAGLGPSAAGPLLVLLVAVAALLECGVLCSTAVRRQRQHQATAILRWRQCVPTLAFKGTVIAAPGVAWAAAGIIQRDAATSTSLSSGPHAAALCLCLAYLLAVPAIAAAVVFRAAPAHFESVPPRLWRSASRLVRWVHPNGQWVPSNADTTACTNEVDRSASVVEAVAAAVGSVRGVAAGRNGQLLCTVSTILSTFVFALTVAPPASQGCAGRHYATAAVVAVLAVGVVGLRPFNTRATNALTGLVLLLVAAAMIAVGDVGTGGSAAIGFSVTAVVISIVRSAHGVWLLRHVTTVNTGTSNTLDTDRTSMDTACLNDYNLKIHDQ